MKDFLYNHTRFIMHQEWFLNHLEAFLTLTDWFRLDVEDFWNAVTLLVIVISLFTLIIF